MFLSPSPSFPPLLSFTIRLFRILWKRVHVSALTTQTRMAHSAHTNMHLSNGISYDARNSPATHCWMKKHEKKMHEILAETYIASIVVELFARHQLLMGIQFLYDLPTIWNNSLGTRNASDPVCRHHRSKWMKKKRKIMRKTDVGMFYTFVVQCSVDVCRIEQSEIASK